MTFRLIPFLYRFPFKNSDKLSSLISNNGLVNSKRQYSVCSRPFTKNKVDALFKSAPCKPAVGYNFIVRHKTDARSELSKKGPITWKSFAAFIGVAAVLLGYFFYLREKKRALLTKQMKQAIGKVAIGGRFDLVNHDGVPTKSEDFLGNWLLIYFGFTHCPDICPEEMEKLAKVVEILEKDKSLPPVKPLFITVDPQRDTVPVVKKYIREFSDKIIGLTGSIEQVAAACKAYRVYFSPGPKDDDTDYIVDHTIIIYLVDSKGNFIDYYTQNRSIPEVVDGVKLNIFKFDENHQKGFFGNILSQFKGDNNIA